MSASAALQPVRRSFGELTIPRVRAGTVSIPSRGARGQMRVIATLKLPPLAAAFQRGLYSHAAERRLDVASASSRAYLERVNAAQRRAIAALHRAIPQARVTRRFRILLDGLTVTLPVKKLPQLVRLGFVRKVYPTYRYTLDLNESPGIIQADAFEAATGDRGDGIKIGVVDDGIDQTNPFFDPTGYTYPAGFPKGDTQFTTPKVIVARAFPGPGSGKPGRLPLDRKASFHGTHVSGIAAGDSGTTATAGPDHPTVTGLSGVAPRAYLGNYRVFNVPSPIGNLAETPEIIAAFESAVADGMQVINFSGGGAQTDPVNDAMIETLTNVVAAGVVPVIASGNDRDDFGFGTAGSPGSAPDAISVAAVSSNHVFGPVLSVTAPQVAGPPIPIAAAPNVVPPAWATIDQKLVDVGTIVGTDGKPVDPRLCGPPGDLNRPVSTLPAGSLSGAIALVSRGDCTFVSKAQRAQAVGAIGIIFVDNRAGDANGVPIQLPIPAGMISDLDGTRLRQATAATGGQATVHVGRTFQQIDTGRSGIVTSFSSAGVTAFGHDLKPDISAPGAQILSSTLTEFAGAPFAVFDGTSMATPHIAGAAALLLQLHPSWSPKQVKSALMSTAGPAWVDTARTSEAAVTLEGAGLAQLVPAADPKVFTDPQSLSFHDLDLTRGAVSRPLLVTIDDAGGGGGTWNVGLQVQSATDKAFVDVPTTVTLSPGGEAYLPVVARALADAAAGDDYGFVVLRRGDVARRIPYFFSVTRPAFEGMPAIPLQPLQIGDTSTGVNRASVYRWPTAPFGPSSFYSGKPTVNEDGAEKLYVVHVNEPVANVGVAVIIASRGAVIDPWFLGSPDQNDVEGYAGMPVNVNEFMFDFRADVGAAGEVFPRQKAFYIAVDSGHDDFTGRSFAGKYLLRAWLNDVSPPLVVPVTTRVAAGRPTLVVRAVDLQSGVDPLSLVIAYGRVLVGAAFYDPISGLAVFPLPPQAPKLKPGSTRAILVGSDYQETKNVATVPGGDLEPNTAFVPARLRVVKGEALTWLAPEARDCVGATARLTVVASSTAKLRSVEFLDGTRRIATAKHNVAGLFAANWRTRGAAKGAHRLVAVLTDRAGRTASAERTVRVCTR